MSNEQMFIILTVYFVMGTLTTAYMFRAVSQAINSHVLATKTIWLAIASQDSTPLEVKEAILATFPNGTNKPVRKAG